MKAVVRTDEYTIYQKRSERYAVRDKNRSWVNGDAKVAILLEHKLIEAPKPKAPAPEPAVEEPAAEAAVTEEAGTETPAEESASEADKPGE